MKLKEIIESRITEFGNLCRKNNVEKLFAFGSSITEKFDEKSSDIDLLVEIDEPDPIKRGEKLLNFWDQLEYFFQRKVDLLTNSSLKNPVLRERIDKTKILLYDGRGDKVFV